VTTPWRSIDKGALWLLHGESLAEHGGAAGMRDEALLDSALARPVHLAAYESPGIEAMAAAYAVGIAKNHPFVDGNKRAAFLAVGLFLAINGYRLTAGQPEATVTMLAVAAGDISEAEFAAWLRENIRKR
jgi:death-on-curing protein